MQARGSGPVLAIDSAGPCPGLALADGQRLLAERYPEAGAGKNEALVACLAALFEQCAVAPAELAGIGVAVGPGSYTGLRVGLALARGLALADELPAFGLGSLELLMVSWLAVRPGSAGSGDGTGLLAASDAGGSRAYVARFGPAGGSQEGEPELVEKAGLADLLAREGRSLVAEAGVLDKTTGLGGSRAPERRAGYLALETVRGLAQGQAVGAASLMPVYAGQPGARPNSERVRVSS